MGTMCVGGDASSGGPVTYYWSPRRDLRLCVGEVGEGYLPVDLMTLQLMKS